MSESDAEVQARLESLHAVFIEGVPHAKALGMKVVGLLPEAGQVTVALPYDARLVGNPQTGVLHGGAVTTLMDSACGIAVYLRLERMVQVATLDLRIDYLRPAQPGQTLLAQAECYKLTRQVAFVRALAHHGDTGDPVANATGTFILTEAPLSGGTREGA